MAVQTASVPKITCCIRYKKWDDSACGSEKTIATPHGGYDDLLW